jgi:hypothetical protein
MTMLDAIRPLFDHMEWADATVWRAVAACAGAADDKVLHDRLHHIHATQHAFLQAWRGEELRCAQRNRSAGVSPAGPAASRR